MIFGCLIHAQNGLNTSYFYNYFYFRPNGLANNANQTKFIVYRV